MALELADGVWEGKAGGLAGGLSGFANFEVINDFMPSEYMPPARVAMVTKSSTLSQPIPYCLYEKVRDLASAVEPDQWAKQALMQALFELLERHLSDQDAPQDAGWKVVGLPWRYDYEDSGSFYLARARQAYGPGRLVAMRGPGGVIELVQRAQEPADEFEERARSYFIEHGEETGR